MVSRLARWTVVIPGAQLAKTGGWAEGYCPWVGQALSGEPSGEDGDKGGLELMMARRRGGIFQRLIFHNKSGNRRLIFPNKSGNRRLIFPNKIGINECN